MVETVLGAGGTMVSKAAKVPVLSPPQGLLSMIPKSTVPAWNSPLNSRQMCQTSASASPPDV